MRGKTISKKTNGKYGLDLINLISTFSIFVGVFSVGFPLGFFRVYGAMQNVVYYIIASLHISAKLFKSFQQALDRETMRR